MAEIITGPFHMDEQGFLATIEELIERFDGYSSGKYFAELGKIHDEYGEIGPLSLFDEKVCELGERIILQHIMGGESGVGHDFVRL